MCVVTKLNFFEGQLSQSVHPDPFRNECLNMIEWLMVSMIPFLVIGFVSLVFLLRKVRATATLGLLPHMKLHCIKFFQLWPFLGINTTLGGLLPLDDKTYKHRWVHFRHDFRFRNISVLRHSIGVNFVKHKLKLNVRLWTHGFLLLMDWPHFKKLKIHSRLLSKKR